MDAVLAASLRSWSHLMHTNSLQLTSSAGQINERVAHQSYSVTVRMYTPDDQVAKE